MGLFFRKRINISKGISLNASKSGFGLSFGIKGLRASISPNGKKQINIGRNGVYYRKTITDSKPQNINSELDAEIVKSPLFWILLTISSFIFVQILMRLFL